MEVNGRLYVLAPLYPGKESHGTHCIVGWVGPKHNLVAWRRENSLASVQI